VRWPIIIILYRVPEAFQNIIFAGELIPAMKRIIYILITCVLTLAACDRFEFHPYQTEMKGYEYKNLNKSNIEKLRAIPEKDTLYLVFTGDHQGYYSQVESMIRKINELPQLDAVFITGDLSDFSLIREFQWLNRELEKLKAPFITVIGNHDCLLNGTSIYEETYGPLNESFDWQGIRFILHNTNSREFSFNGMVPDLQWMRDQISDSSAYEACIFISHILPYHPDFDPSLEIPYSELVRSAKNTLFSMHGHNHVADSLMPYNDNIIYYNTSSPFYEVFYYTKVYKNNTGRYTWQLTPIQF